MTISVIIPFKATDAHDIVLLADLVKQILSQGENIIDEIIIVDSTTSNISDELYCMLKAFNSVKIFHAPTTEVGEARNIGVNIAKNNFILFLDSDCKLPAGFIANVKRLLFELSDDIAAIGGPVESIATKSLVQKFFDFSLFSPFPNYKKDYISSWNNFYRHHHPNMCNLLVRKDIFLKIGGCWSGSGEDVYYLLRAASQGYKIRYTPAMLVYHHHPRRIHMLIKKYYSLGGSAAKLFLTFPTSPLMIQRALRFLLIFLPGVVVSFLSIPLSIAIVIIPLSVYYFKKSKNLKMALIYPMFDIFFQLIYAISFISSLIRELIKSVKQHDRD